MTPQKKKAISMFLPLVIVVIAIIIAFCALFNDSFTWFMRNETISATGMKVEVRSPGCLVISKTSIDYTDTDPLGFDINWSETAAPGATAAPATILEPAARIDGSLWTFSGDDVDVTTGIVNDGATKTPARLGENFLCYDSYIGVVGKNLYFDRLEVSFSNKWTSSDPTVYKCCTVDVFIKYGITEYYMGTIDYFNNNPIVLKTIGTGDSRETITSLQTNGTTYHIVYYCYFDGAMTETVGGVTRAVYRPETASKAVMNVSLVIDAVNATETAPSGD